MLSDKCNLQGLSGITRLDHVGPYVIVTNRLLHEVGESSRYALINEVNLWVRSFYSTQGAAVLSAQWHSKSRPIPIKVRSNQISPQNDSGD
jgi:hypothetical protein